MELGKCKIGHQHIVRVNIDSIAHNMLKITCRNMHVNNSLDIFTEIVLLKNILNSFIFPEFSLKIMEVEVAFSQ